MHSPDPFLHKHLHYRHVFARPYAINLALLNFPFRETFQESFQEESHGERGRYGGQYKLFQPGSSDPVNSILEVFLNVFTRSCFCLAGRQKAGRADEKNKLNFANLIPPLEL